MTMKNVHIVSMHTGICLYTKNMELLKFYSKDKTNFFWLNKIAIY